MGNDDAEQQNPPPRHHYNGRGSGSGAAHSHQFPVGSLVEVQTNKKHLKCIYFSATVVAPPIIPRKKVTTTIPKDPKRIYVEYVNRLAREDRPDPLREHVELSCVRPALPLLEVAEGFQQNDVVDAFHMDGWRKGVVSRVVEGGDNFAVRFDNQPDELEFGPSGLRAHWDWVDGVWVWPAKEGGVIYEVGMKVEAWFLSGNEFYGAWYPATFVKDLGNGWFLVELKYNDGDCVRSEVDRVHLRPSPPIIKEWEFQASEKVDVFHNFGWWSGLIRKSNGIVITVFLEQMSSERVFDLSDLRPRMDWKDAKWSIGFDNHRASPSATKKRRIGSREFLWVFSDSGGALKKPPNQETENIAIQVEDDENCVGFDERVVEDDVENSVDFDEDDVENRVGFGERVVEDDVENSVGFDEEVERFVSMLDDDDDNDSKDSEILHASVLADKSSAEAIEAQSWPFVKRNEVWKAFESMEVFKKMPQKPHFKPLEEFKESQREGLAIACMVTFTNVVESICSMKMSDPKCVADDINETLVDLEAHGFDVAKMRERVAGLMAAKDEEEMLVDKVKDLNDQILERKLRKGRIKREIRATSENVRRLQEQLVLSEIARAMEVDEIAKLQSELEGTHECIKNLRCGFGGGAAPAFVL